MIADYQGLVTKWREAVRDCPCLECRMRNECADELAEVIARNVQPSPDATQCPQCRADDFTNPYTDANGVLMRTCGRCMIQWREARPVQQPATEPDATGRAIEHGGYLATAAENYLNERNRYQIAVAGYSDEETTEVADADSLADHHQALRVAIYEFRKRAALALRDVPQGPNNQEEFEKYAKQHRLDIRPSEWQQSDWTYADADVESHWQCWLAARQVPVGPEGKK